MAQTRPVVIVTFGDSITAAANQMPDASMRWPSLLQDGLRAKFPNAAGIAVINAGVGGNTSREGLARMDKDVIAHDPDYVLVEFGGNDAGAEPPRHVPLDEFVANLRAIKTKIDAIGHCRMVLLTFPPVNDRTHHARERFAAIGGQDRNIEKYRKATRDLALGHGLTLIDTDQALRPRHEECILGDGVHLNAEGNRVMAQAVLPVMIRLLAACRR